MADFCIKTGDTLPKLEATLKKANGGVVDLTGCSVTLVWADSVTGAKRSGGAVVVTSDGDVEYSWENNDLPVPGTYYGEWKVTYPNGKVESFPSHGYINIKVLASL